MKKLLTLLITVAAVIIGVIIINKGNKNNESIPWAGTGIKVAASFYPLYEFAKQVAGEKAKVVNITPSGIEPHDFEPSPQDIAKIYSAKIFIFNGSGFDPWAEKIKQDLEKHGVAVINMTEHFELLQGGKDEEENLDPHIWLDPILAKEEVEIIRDELKKNDPRRAASYDSNAEQYLAKLSELDEKYKTGLASCAIRDAVASHAAFGYLGKRYNINIVAIAGISPEQEPSAKKLAEIAEFARGKNIKYIFFETLVSPRTADTIAKEIGAETLVFNPLEGLTEEETAAGKNYFSIMEENLEALRKAFLCA